MAKLTDRQRKQIIAEYVAGDGKVSHRDLAAKYKVSPTTIAKVLQDDKSVQKCAHKKEENTLSMLEYLDSRKNTAQALMEKILTLSEKDIASAKLRDKMGALKILAEVFATPKGKEGSESDGGVKFEFVFKDTSIKNEPKDNT